MAKQTSTLNKPKRDKIENRGGSGAGCLPALLNRSSKEAATLLIIPTRDLHLVMCQLAYQLASLLLVQISCNTSHQIIPPNNVSNHHTQQHNLARVYLAELEVCPAVLVVGAPFFASDLTAICCCVPFAVGPLCAD